MALAPAADQRVLAERAFDHDAGHVRGSAHEGDRAVMEELRIAHVLLVVLHVLRAPAPRVRDERKLWELAAELREEGENLPDHRLHVVLAARHDERDDLVPQQVAVRERLLVLDAVHALNHLVVEAAGAAPADRRRDDDDVGPVHDALVHLLHLVPGVHLGDGAGPGAGAGGLRVETLAGTEGQIAHADQPRFALAFAALSRIGEPVHQEILGRAVARVALRHRRRRNAEDADRPGLAYGRARERMRFVRQPAALRDGLLRDEHAAVLDLDRMRRHAVRLVAGLARAGLPVELVVVPWADDEVAVERALAEGTADVVAGAGDRAELAVAAGQCDALRADAHFLHGQSRELCARANVSPPAACHLPWPRYRKATTAPRMSVMIVSSTICLAARAPGVGCTT